MNEDCKCQSADYSENGGASEAHWETQSALEGNAFGLGL